MKKKLEKGAENEINHRPKGFFALFKVFGLFLFLSLCSNSAVLANSILQNTKISVNQTNVSISKVLDDIAQKTGYSVLVRDNDINTSTKISVNLKDKSLEQVLAAVFKGMDVKYDIVDKTISVYKPQKSSVVSKLNPPEKRQIAGQVIDSNGEPVIGANVLEKGDKVNGTITDLDGKFSLNVSDNATLIVSFIGFTTQEIAVKNKRDFNIVLIDDTKALEEVVVVGYTSQKKASLTGAISNVKVDENLRNISSSNMTGLLAGTMPGLNITSTTGVPGTSANMLIRTQSSFAKDKDDKLIPTSPIFVIDGIVRSKDDFDRLDANEVDNITILKDAASAAIYGARASGGVVLVTTRKGKSGKPMLSYSGSFAVEQRGKGVDLTSGVEAALIANYIHRDNPETGAYWDEDELDHLRGINNGWGYNHVDDNWRAPTSTHHSVNVSGGTDKLRYFANGSYFKQNGFLDKVDYSRYNFRGNLEMDVTKDLTAFVQFGSVYGTKNKIGFEGENDLSGLYGKLQYWQWEQKTYTSDGKPVDYGWLGNIGEFSRGSSGYNKDEFQSTELQFKMQYKVPFLEGLKVSAMYNHKYANDYGKAYSKKQLLYQVKKLGRHQHIWTDEIIGTTYSAWPDKPSLKQLNTRNRDYQLNLQADYARTFGDHDISALFVYEQMEGDKRYFEAGRETFPILIKDQWFATSGDRKDSWVKGDETEQGRLSYITQVNYSYADKYLLSASLRIDGSMNYAPSKRYGYFPAVSGAWIISQEKFFNTSKIDFLKLRASAGLTGSDSQIGWRWQERYAYNSGESGQRLSYFGNPPGTSQAIRFDGIVNPNATWEKSFSYNIGADIHFLDHWSASADFWYKNTYDILADRVLSLPTTFGFSMPKENYGEVHSKGLDLEISYNNRAGKVNYFVKGVFSYGTNEVIIQDYAENAMDRDIPVGKKIGYMQGFRDLGIVRTQAQLDEINAYYKGVYGEDHEFTLWGHKLGLGMLNYQDINGPDGKPDGKIDDYDKDVLSMHSVPPVTAGLTLGAEWKGISIQTLFQGAFGHNRFADGKFRDLLEWNRMPDKWIDHWTPENPNASMPQPVSFNDGVKNNYNKESTFWLYNADYVKMKYLNVGYRLPQSWVNKLGAGYVKVYFSATNLFSISSFKLWDPEVESSSSYPNMKTFNFGLDFSF